MSKNDYYLGCYCPMHQLMTMGNEINHRVLEKIKDTLELVMVNDFTREYNENQYKSCLQNRMADIASWRWVLEDLSKRLEESKLSLKYELKAGKVVVRRLEEEIEQHSKMATKPGALYPKSDHVEAVILEEFKFLQDQKQIFEEFCVILEKQMNNLDKTLDNIKGDILNKDETLEIEQAVANINAKNLSQVNIKPKLKKRVFSLERWESRCLALKQEGLRVLNDALLTKQQIRGARNQLTVAAQILASKVDVAIRRRLHANHIKFQELEWQKQQAEADLQALQNEQINTEKSVIANLEQIRAIEARLADRSYRPNGEMTEDEVDQSLKMELTRVRRFIADLRSNLKEIDALQIYLKNTIEKIDCYIADINEIITLDEERTEARLGGAEGYPSPSPSTSSTSPRGSNAVEGNLSTIREEDEEPDIKDPNLQSGKEEKPEITDPDQLVKDEDIKPEIPDSNSVQKVNEDEIDDYPLDE